MRIRACSVAVLLVANVADSSAATLKVMTFNVWVGENTLAGRNKLAQIIQASDADIVGLQEMTNSAGVSIAAQLGMHYRQQSAGDIQVLSKFPILDSSPAGYGVEIQYGADASLWLFNAHLAAYPYQPYDLRDGVLPMNESAVVAAANAARGSEVTAYLADMASAATVAQPLILVGDFNEPSHLDWTTAAAAATPRPFDLKVAYPASSRIVDVGLVDSFREVRPDEVADPGYTWTPGYPPPMLDANEVQDRIDILYHRGAGVAALDASIVGPTGDMYTDLGVPGYNADHRAVVVEYALPDVSSLVGDFNGDGLLTAFDWNVLRGHQLADLSGFSVFDAYARGDLNGDRRNDHADFVMFKTAFERMNGGGSFEAMLASVPEPSSVLLAAIGLGLVRRRRPQR